jgi:hypothetical protein
MIALADSTDDRCLANWMGSLGFGSIMIIRAVIISVMDKWSVCSMNKSRKQSRVFKSQPLNDHRCVRADITLLDRAKRAVMVIGYLTFLGSIYPVTL